ncbi:Pollen Ole e 1 allergen/extensin [Corchorus olitorius]|uniref:Pollen Ole e 1 allergen/extensin n=1 Tax=Corchorus olitorius TaxID=93759 RepID=A0A1R3IHD6_9ROSI|nr:Pollen Ole e 1 allergen/extensin [Corchorus olitorius]
MALKNLFSATLLMLLGLSFAASVLASDGYYNPNPNSNLQKPADVEKERLLSKLIGVQGIIYCRAGNKITPLEGAVARITCEGVDEYGYETESLSILSCATDAKGYFIATLSPHEVKHTKLNRRFKQCKAFLEASPSDDCDLPTDVNKGISGAPIASYRLLPDKNMKLFTVGPFFFIPQQDTNSVSPDGY